MAVRPSATGDARASEKSPPGNKGSGIVNCRIRESGCPTAHDAAPRYENLFPMQTYRV